MAKGNTIILYNSGVPGDIPNVANLAFGEIAINYTDALIYFKNANSAIVSFGPVSVALTAAAVANTIAVQSGASANQALTIANTANTIAKQSGLQANSAFAEANVANTLAQAAYTAANNAGGITVGAANSVAVYANPGVIVAPLLTVNSSVLVANATGVLSMNTALPKGITANVPNLGDNTATISTMQSIMLAMQHIRVNVVTITANQTWTPDVNLMYATLETWGPGGGGGGTVNSGATARTQGGGGGAGSYSRATVSRATVGASQTVTIGQAGPGGAAGTNNGGQGGNTSIGTLCTANGGSGGTGSAAGNAPGGAGGIRGIGDFTANGSAGFFGGTQTNSNNLPSGRGGISPVGDCPDLVNFQQNGSTATGFAAGGGGGVSSSSGGAQAGGNGAPGLAVITQICWG
jgi:hypothetical protein